MPADVEALHRIRAVVTPYDFTPQFLQGLFYNRRGGNPFMAIAYEGRAWMLYHALRIGQVKKDDPMRFQLPDPFAERFAPVLDVLQAVRTGHVVQ